MLHKFDKRKALEVAVYLSGRTRGFPEFIGTLYLANKLHLFRYGRSIVSDTYTSNTLKGEQMVALLREASSPETLNPSILRSEENLKRSVFVPTREADMQFLSETDVECLDHAVEMVSVLSYGTVREIWNSEGYALLDVANDKFAANGKRMSIRVLVRGIKDLDDMDVAETMSRKPERLVRYISGADEEESE